MVLYHLGLYQKAILHAPGLAQIASGAFGFYGVALFFAISGYLMSIAVRVQSPFAFLTHRIIRIYPPYWCTIALFLVIAAIGGHPMTFDWRALTLMPFDKVDFDIVRVEWTLIFEMTFYVALFGIALAGLARWIEWIGLGWLAGLGVVALTSRYQEFQHLLPAAGRLLIMSACVPMAGGLCLPALLKRRCPFWLPLLGAALIWLAYFGFGIGSDGPDIERGYLVSRWLAGGSGLLTVYGMLCLPERSEGSSPPAIASLLSRYGDYSYGLYLCHVPIVFVICTHAGSLPIWMVTIAALAACLASAAALGTIDVALYRRLKAALGCHPAFLRLAALGYAPVFIMASIQGTLALEHRERDRLAVEAAVRAFGHAGRFFTQGQIDAAARQAGFRQSTDLRGSVDSATWDVPSGLLIVTGWGLDFGKHHTRLTAALFEDGRFLDVMTPDTTRSDIRDGFHILGDNMFLFPYAQPCHPARIAVALFSADKRFAVLPELIKPIVCPG